MYFILINGKISVYFKARYLNHIFVLKKHTYLPNMVLSYKILLFIVWIFLAGNNTVFMTGMSELVA